MRRNTGAHRWVMRLFVASSSIGHILDIVSTTFTPPPTPLASASNNFTLSVLYLNKKIPLIYLSFCSMRQFRSEWHFHLEWTWPCSELEALTGFIGGIQCVACVLKEVVKPLPETTWCHQFDKFLPRFAQPSEAARRVRKDKTYKMCAHDEMSSAGCTRCTGQAGLGVVWFVLDYVTPPSEKPRHLLWHAVLSQLLLC